MLLLLCSVITLCLPDSLARAASAPDLWEPNDSAGQAKILFYGVPSPYRVNISGTLHSVSDEDWYRFSGGTGDMLVADVYNISSGTNCSLQIYDGNGNLLPYSLLDPNQAPDNEPEHLVYWKLDNAGWYHLRVAASAVGASSDYNLWVSLKPWRRLARPTIEASRLTYFFDKNGDTPGATCFLCYPNLCPTDQYGNTPVGHAYNTHRGTDYGWVNSSTVGWDTVYSSVDGWVHAISYDASSGYYVGTRNADYRTAYLHLRSDSHFVTLWQAVPMGRRLSYMGNTGNSFGKHVHFNLMTSTSDTRLCPYSESLFYWGCSQNEY